MRSHRSMRAMQTRSGGDGWELGDVPLSEDFEQYVVDILSGPTVVRSIAASTTEVVYAAADETADFGVAQTGLHLRISQFSRSAGAGAAFESVVSVA